MNQLIDYSHLFCCNKSGAADAAAVMNGFLPEPALAHAGNPFGRTEGGNAAFHNFHNDYSHITDPNLRRRLALAEIDKVSRAAPYQSIRSGTNERRSHLDGIMFELY